MKIKAFTLMEVTVAMLISAICITVCYTAYSIIANYYSSFQLKNQAADHVLSLKQVMEIDFLKSNCLLKTEDGIELLQDSTAIQYTFTNSTVLRKLGVLHTDTFKVQYSNLKTYFETNEIVETDTIDRVNFTVLLNQTSVPIQINKYYSAKDLFH
jgi:prepilin-type N-terminal cleavage/methylation domain-containing protein